MANIVDKYFNKKKKDIYEYSKMINTLIKYENNQIWNNDSEFNEYIKKIINRYVEMYYFKSIENYTEYEEYLGALVKCDDRFKTILVCAVDSISEENKKGNYKVSAYIASLIVYTAVALNRFTYPYHNYKINITNVFSIIDAMFKNIDFVVYKDNSKLRNELISIIKKNNNCEDKFIEYLDIINKSNSKNVYESVDLESKYYKVSYKYDIPEFKNYRQRDVAKFFKRIKDDLNVLSYELTTIAVLKSKLLNKDITFLFPAELEFYKKESEINKLLKVTSNEEIKNNIKLLINYDDYNKNKEMVRILINAGFDLALEFDSPSDVPYRTFNEIKTAVVPRDFMNVNKGNVDSWKENGINFVIKSEIKEISSELEMLGLEKK